MGEPGEHGKPGAAGDPGHGGAGGAGGVGGAGEPAGPGGVGGEGGRGGEGLGKEYMQRMSEPRVTKIERAFLLIGAWSASLLAAIYIIVGHL